jgi:glycosyltransferase involved in cell wall biosynthesis
MKKKGKNDKHPFVSICTPTFNRRPFIPIMVKCFENQTYPKDKMEWIIVDDGTDKIEDLVAHIPQVKYFRYDNKLSLGTKRNITNEQAKGDIIIYMDDDDYYPSDRVSHAVDTLQKNPKALCAGSSAMYIYFKHIQKMYQFGPYGPNHATAATFAFRKELLKQTRFDETASLAEEKKFLKDYTIPFVQLDPLKSILVFSHNHNSFDKKELLKQLPNPFIKDTSIKPSDIVKEYGILQFFMEDINKLLDDYAPGLPENKPDVLKQIVQMKETREKMMQDNIKKNNEYNSLIQKLSNQVNSQPGQGKINELSLVVQELSIENTQLKDKVKYLEDKIKQLIIEQIQLKRNSTADQNKI